MDDQPRVGQRIDLLVRFHVDEIQQIMSTATAGTFRLTHRGKTTDPIPWDATCQDVEEALEAITTVGPGGVVCSGGPHPAQPVKVRFTSGQGKRSQPELLVDAADLTGTVTVTTTQPGGPTQLDTIPVVKVEDPAGVVSSPLTVTALGGGTYQASVTPTSAGLHRWSAVGATAAHGAVEVEDVFTVLPRTVD